MTLDRKLNFISHINNVTTKAAKVVGFIKRNTKSFKKVAASLLLYKTLVRSILEYSSVAWNPFYAGHSQRLESIQRSFTRHLYWKHNRFKHRLNYNDRLTYFKLDTLSKRRKYADMIFLHNVMSGKCCIPEILYRIKLRTPIRPPPLRRPLSNIFVLPRYRTNIGKNAPISRLCSTYNFLNSKNFNKLDIFRFRLAQFKSHIRKCEFE